MKWNYVEEEIIVQMVLADKHPDWSAHENLVQLRDRIWALALKDEETPSDLRKA